jgi:FtsZ-interacting cell division protein YlmF
MCKGTSCLRISKTIIQLVPLLDAVILVLFQEVVKEEEGEKEEEEEEEEEEEVEEEEEETEQPPKKTRGPESRVESQPQQVCVYVLSPSYSRCVCVCLFVRVI